MSRQFAFVILLGLGICSSAWSVHILKQAEYTLRSYPEELTRHPSWQDNTNFEEAISFFQTAPASTWIVTRSWKRFLSESDENHYFFDAYFSAPNGAVLTFTFEWIQGQIFVPGAHQSFASVDDALQTALANYQAGISNSQTLPIPQPSNECQICLENQATHAFNPCGHYAVCPTCAPQFSVGTPCPFCRSAIESLIRIYKPM